MSVTHLSMIAACDINGVIGFQNRLPWDSLEGDLARFKKLTENKVLVMGRKTVASLPFKLPNRKVVMVTRRGLYLEDTKLGSSKHDLTSRDLGSAVSTAMTLRKNLGDEIFIAGGGEIYRWAWGHVGKLYLTVAKKAYEGDVKVTEFADLISAKDGTWDCVTHESYSDNDYFVFVRNANHHSQYIVHDISK